MVGNNRCTVITEENVDDNNIGRASVNGYKSYQDDPSALGQQQKILNSSQNVLLVYRLNEMRQLERTNFTLAIACLVYCGINIALIIVNYVNSQNQEDPPISEKAFHLLEFWATFCFAIVTCISLTSTPKSILNIYNSPMTLRLILFFNIVASSMPAMLMSLNTEYFEIISHQIEYLNELTTSFIDLVLLWSLCKFEGANAIMAVIASIVACVQLAIYNGMGRTDDGDMIGEVPAHFLEFAFGIISSLIAFAFCMDNKFVCKKEIGQILYGTHIDCTICRASSTEYSGTYVTSTAKPRNFDRYGSV
mmetsp:Transcript_19935/g.31108  ORF Transcript_19935/g.31108 Transcript_19935/m.31108 type:complete len:306 (+) Transcript_19935:237-1154(+)|eukprot:CAMPEP_0201719740 /NCGR_PEP_ID=MMETSP0593-20130828/4888_1 /ASSEMBLY_ACC=CAM_ASM_000672 /TAXON_ID=267983 /ORGANISM="Skeletonema japonicum, Strain CCMP2506" /LENGTH=305 /DNA_ID=CAMNT_0048210257 /DNA_START=127 /DNA_END=1044 /DNA_ORIENTATION=+